MHNFESTAQDKKIVIQTALRQCYLYKVKLTSRCENADTFATGTSWNCESSRTDVTGRNLQVSMTDGFCWIYHQFFSGIIQCKKK